VVPAEGDIRETEPFEPAWDESADALIARGTADVKANPAACAFAARDLGDADPDLDGRVVVDT